MLREIPEEDESGTLGCGIASHTHPDYRDGTGVGAHAEQQTGMSVTTAGSDYQLVYGLFQRLDLLKDFTRRRHVTQSAEWGVAG